MREASKRDKRTMIAQADAVNELCILSFTDSLGIITHSNDLFCKISGYSRDELIGKPHSVICSGYHSREFFKEMWTTISSGQIWWGEICNKAKNGNSYWVDTRIVPSFNVRNEIEQYICIRYDITQRKIAESSLIQTFKMATLGALASCISHEIKNPLAIISGQTSLLLKQLCSGSVPKEYLKRGLQYIEKAASQMVHMVNGITTLSHDENSESLDKMSISSILLDALGLCQYKIKNSGILVKTEGDLNLVINCRPVQMTQVLINLISNAIDAIENLPEKWIVIHVENEIGKNICISVTDSGAGIPPEILDRIMSPFFTTKGVSKGTGLGLTISKKIIESHDGQLHYDPISANTRFNILLPNGLRWNKSLKTKTLQLV